MISWKFIMDQLLSIVRQWYTLPSSFTSTAVGGNLTFRFTSDIVVDKGWIATISCVPLTPAAAITDYAMVSL
jgi:hypothetical protein